MTENKGIIQNAVSAKKQTNAVEKAKKMQFSALIKSDAVQNSLNGTLGDAARTKTFTSALISAVSTNSDLRECEGMSIISGALLGEALNLSPSPQLGHYYLVPYKDNKTGIKHATFQLGYKGYYQLALRSGQYKSLDVVSIKEGELKSYNPITGEIDIEPIEDPVARENAPTIGYYAYFELINGFKKQMYWSKPKMTAYAEKYSNGYRARKGYTFWEKDFDSMAQKTMLKQIISKYGIMSIDMQKAYINDMTITEDISDNAQPVYFDNVIDAETGEVA